MINKLQILLFLILFLNIGCYLNYNGQRTVMYTNGQLKSIGYYIEGKKNGDFNFYSENGVLQKQLH